MLCTDRQTDGQTDRHYMNYSKDVPDYMKYHCETNFYGTNLASR